MAHQKISTSLVRITAELKDWQRSPSFVKGVIHNTRCIGFKNGETFVFKNYKHIITLPAGAGGPSYHLMRTQLGLYFKMYVKDEKDASLA